MAPEAPYNAAIASNMSSNVYSSGQATYHPNTTSDRPTTLSRQNSGSGVRMSQEAVKILRVWLQDNALHPYPSELEKQELKQKTGLRKEQISNWLANARRRGKVPQALPSSRNSSLSSYFNSPTASSPIAVPRPAGGQLFQEMSPLARYVVQSTQSTLRRKLGTNSVCSKMAQLTSRA